MSEPSRVRTESGTEGTAKPAWLARNATTVRREARYEDFRGPASVPSWRSALVLRDFSGAYLVRHQSSPDTWSDGTYLMHVGEFDWRGPFTVIIDADGRNVEADRRESLSDEVFSENHRTWEDLTNTLHEQLGTAQQSLAEAVRGRETALRDLRASEQHAEKAEDDERLRAWDRIARHPFFVNCYPEERPLIDSMVDRLDRAKEALHRQTIREYQESLSVEVAQAALNQARESYREVRTDLERAGSAYKSARQRAVEWKGTAEAFAEVVVPELNRKIKKLKKQRDKARNANDVRAADELEDLALEISALDWDVPGVTVGRAVQNLIRGRAAKLRGEK